MANNPADMLIHLVTESLAQTSLLVFVVRSGALELIGCWGQNAQSQRAKRRSTRAKTSS
jgi:hypothetical protein